MLNFFPKAWSFICPTEIKAFNARLDEFLYARSCAILFASTDSDQCLKAWNATPEAEGGLGGVHVPLMSDCNHKISRDYGVLIEEEGVAQRALLFIDPKGIVRNIAINDASIGRSVDEAQRILDALIFNDHFGEGCPVDWKKGDRGIEMASKTVVVGPMELKKQSWGEWMSPKIGRALSANSATPRGSTPTSPEGTSQPSMFSTTAPPTEPLHHTCEHLSEEALLSPKTGLRQDDGESDARRTFQAKDRKNSGDVAKSWN